MSLNFFKNYGKAKSKQFGEGLVNLAASLDASGVGEAAIKQKQEEHADVIKQVIEAQDLLKKEKKEFDDLNTLYLKKLAAAERAEADFAVDPSNKDAEAALTELLASVEKIAPKLAKEQAEYESAEHWLNEVQQASNDIAKELLGLREQINEVKQQTKEAELSLDQSKKKLAQAEKLAGLRTATNKFDVAMSALQKQASRTEGEARAAQLTAEQLRKPVEVVSSAASKYLDDVEPSVASETLQEKLARLKAVVK